MGGSFGQHRTHTVGLPVDLGSTHSFQASRCARQEAHDLDSNPRQEDPIQTVGNQFARRVSVTRGSTADHV